MNLTIKYKSQTIPFYIPDGWENNHIEKYLVMGRFYESGPGKVLTFLDEYPQTFRGKIAIDVGANIGNHSVFFHDVLGMTVIAFEPQDEVREVLSHNASGRLIHVSSELVGIHGEVFRKNMIGGHHITEYVSSDNGIKCISLDNKFIDTANERCEIMYDNKGHNLGLIKIDVEGMETKVIMGAEKLIKKYNPVLVVEIREEVDLAEIRTLLSGWGYSVHTRNGKPVAFNHTPTYVFTHTSNPLK